MTLLEDVSMGRADAVSAGLARGEDTTITREPALWFGLAPREGTPTGLPTLLHVAAETNTTDEVVRVLLDAGLPIDARDAMGNTPLHIACRHRRLAIARLLLERGAAPNAEDCAGYAAIDHTVEIDLLELLLAHGAEPDGGARIEWPIRRYEGWPLLERLAWSGHDLLVRRLLDAGADLSKHPRALACACEQKHGELVDLLLDRGADPSAALHDVAISNEHFLRVLLDRGADPNARDASDETPLSRVVQRGLHRPARLLIDRGADLHVTTSSGESLYAAAKRTYDGGLSDGRLVMQLLKEKGVGPLAAAPAAVEPPTPSGPHVGARVTHTKFGGGVITKVDGDALDVTFDDGAKKTLLARFVKLDA